jgi:hypothetical protein
LAVTIAKNLSSLASGLVIRDLLMLLSAKALEHSSQILKAFDGHYQRDESERGAGDE